MEARQLLTVTSYEFPIIGQVIPAPLISAPDGSLGYLRNQPSGNTQVQGTVNTYLDLFNPKTHAVSEFLLGIGSGEPTTPVTGPDGNLWYTYTEAASNRLMLFQLNITTHALTGYQVTGNAPQVLVAGPDGNLWYTTTNSIGEFNLTTKSFTEFALPDNAPLSRIIAGPDGNLWFVTDDNANQIGEINPKTDAISEFQVAPFDYTSFRDHIVKSYVFVITAGPDGNIWFSGETDYESIFSLGVGSSASFLGEINPATHAVSLVDSSVLNQGILTTGPPGNLWFSYGTEIDAVNPTTHVTKHYVIPPELSDPGTITVGSDGNLWFYVALPQQLWEVPINDGPTVVNLPVDGIVDGPTIVNLQRYGVGEQRTKLVLTFDAPLDPASARDVHNYQIVGPHGHPVPVAKAVYNASTDTVTLDPRLRLSLLKSYKLTVVGTGNAGIKGTDGNLLDGKANGEPGSNHFAILNKSLLVKAKHRPARRKGI